LIANILTRPRVFFLSLYPVLRFFNIRDPYNPIEHKQDSLEIMENIPEKWKVKMSNIQAAIGMMQLENLDKHNRKRAENSLLLNKLLEDIKNVFVPLSLTENKHIYLYHVLYIGYDIPMNEIRKSLIKKGIDSQLNELTTPEQLKIFGVEPESFPNFKKIANRLLIIPNGIYLNKKDIENVGTGCKITFNSIF
jgi:dTDP-4-amino-4,6-dideoxygalactose transaminase